MLSWKNSDKTEHLQKAMKIYKIIWDFEPKLIEDNYKEIANMYPQTGAVLKQKFL